MEVLKAAHLTELRSFLKEFKAQAVKKEDEDKVEVVNGLIPAIVDAITDEELSGMANEVWSYVMTTLITRQEQAPEEPAPVEPLVQLTDIK